MFICRHVKNQGFNSILLQEKSTGTSVEIIPECGGILHAFNFFTKDGDLLNIIESYSDKIDFINNVEAKGFRSCKLSPFACRVENATYSFDNTVYTFEKFLLQNNALHGLLYDVPFDLIGLKAREGSAAVKLSYEYKATDKGYPFYYTCKVHYELQQENTLVITTEIVNKSKTVIPIQDGWHPYFTFNKPIDNLLLSFQSDNMLECNNGLIPTGKLIAYNEFNDLKKIGEKTFDNCFVLNFNKQQPLCILKDPDIGIQIEIYPDKSYPYLQIYTPYYRNSIAIENLSAAPDSFNNKMGLRILQPDEQFKCTTTYKLREL